MDMQNTIKRIAVNLNRVPDTLNLQIIGGGIIQNIKITCDICIFPSTSEGDCIVAAGYFNNIRNSIFSSRTRIDSTIEVGGLNRLAQRAIPIIIEFVVGGVHGNSG